METITLCLNENEIENFKDKYENNLSYIKNEYIKYFFKFSDCNISIYKSNKAVFQGKNIDKYTIFFKNDKKIFNHIGSDEVGTGDFFGPIVVVSCIVEKKDYDLLEKLKVTDSKKINDKKIKEIGNILIDNLKHSIQILDNKLYNKVIKENNLNQIKAKMHNQSYLNLVKKYNDIPKMIVQDQFCSVKNYFKYLENEKEIIENIIFETKAESKYLAVACASVIARYVFINKFEKICKENAFNFHKGAGDLVDEDIKNFLKTNHISKLNEIAKTNFKNLKPFIS